MENTPTVTHNLCPSHSAPWAYLCIPEPAKKLGARFMCQQCREENRKKHSRTEFVEVEEVKKVVGEEWGRFEGERGRIVEEVNGFYDLLTLKIKEAVEEDRALTLKLIERLRGLALPSDVTPSSLTDFMSQKWESVNPEELKILYETKMSKKSEAKQESIVNSLQLELGKINDKILSLRYLLLGKKLEADFLNPVRDEESKVGTINQFTRIGGIFNSRDMMIRSVKLVYRASDHEFSPSKFIEFCSDKTHCIAIAKTENGKIVGGYSTLPLASKKDKEVVEDTSRTSFIMNLNTIRTYSMTGEKALQYSKQSSGPLFGEDLRLDSTVTANLGNFYQTPDGVKPGSMEAKFNFLNKESSMETSVLR